MSVSYCIGQIDAYINDNVPKDFWMANAVYVAQASLFSIRWDEKFGRKHSNMSTIQYKNPENIRV